jgi:cytochrome c2
LLALNIAAGAVFAPQKPAKPGFDIAVKEGGGEQGAAAAKEPDQPIETLLAKASVEKGQAAAKQCQACHTFEKGGPNRVGPNLWNIVGSPRGEARGGFNFSAAMKSKGGNWTFRRAQQVPGQSTRLHPRDEHDIRRIFEGGSACRRHRLSAHFVRQPVAAAQGGRGRCAARWWRARPRNRHYEHLTGRAFARPLCSCATFWHGKLSLLRRGQSVHRWRGTGKAT